jgi:putative addiction module component (TIGR02574 family)
VSTVEEIRTAIPKLSAEEKLQTMEALWESLSSKPDAVESPGWHEKELLDRERDIESGKSKFIDWETAKADIRRRTS